jgi:riboflavin biosynthesis pyrimidine reductase
MRQLLPTYAEAVDLLAHYAGPATYVRAGFVTSVDGGTVADGTSRSLSGPADRAVFRTLRAVCDVILVGAGTARAEDYGTIRLTDDGAAWRAAQGLSALPRVAVVSRSLDIDDRVLAGPRPLVITCASADTARLGDRADVIVAGQDEVDIAAALDALAARGLGRVLCEGGPTLLEAIVRAGRLDELCLTTAPLLVGGARTLLPEPFATPVELSLEHLLEDDGVLLGRYTLVRYDPSV